MHHQGLWDTVAIYTAKTNPVEGPGCKNICITMFYPVRSKYETELHFAKLEMLILMFSSAIMSKHQPLLPHQQ